MSPFCFAFQRNGRWLGVCRDGDDEHTTSESYDTSEQAIEAARQIAAELSSKQQQQGET